MADELGKLFLRGKEAFERRNYDYAIDLFRQILSLNPDHMDARRALRICEMKKYEEIGYPSRFSTMPLSAKTETQIRLQSKSPEKVIDTCEGHLARDPRNVRVRIALAQALQATGHLDGAAAELEMARDVQADNVELLRSLGEIYSLQGKIPEARACLKRALQLAPDNRLLNKALNDLEATATMRKGYEAEDYHGALKDQDQAASLEADQHLVKTEDELQTAAAHFDTQVGTASTEREKVKLLKKKGEMLERGEDLEGARAAFQAALDIDRMDTTLKDKVEDLQIKRMDAALRAAKEQAKSNPKDAVAVGEAKRLHAEKLKFEAAAWERRVKDRPTDLGARFELGKRCYLTGAVDKAIGEFQQTVKDPKRKVDSHWYLGMAFRHKGMADLAATQLDKALEVGGLSQEREHTIRYELAKTLEAADPAKALVEYKRIMEQDISFKDVVQRVEELQKKVDA